LLIIEMPDRTTDVFGKIYREGVAIPGSQLAAADDDAGDVG
jgi:hypothetical protein